MQPDTTKPDQSAEIEESNEKEIEGKFVILSFGLVYGLQGSFKTKNELLFGFFYQTKGLKV